MLMNVKTTIWMAALKTIAHERVLGISWLISCLYCAVHATVFLPLVLMIFTAGSAYQHGRVNWCGKCGEHIPNLQSCYNLIKLESPAQKQKREILRNSI